MREDDRPTAPSQLFLFAGMGFLAAGTYAPQNAEWLAAFGLAALFWAGRFWIAELVWSR